MDKINKVIEELENKYNSIDSSNEEREVMRVQRVLNEALAVRNTKNEQKRSVLTELEYWIQVKEKYLELSDVEEELEEEKEEGE